MFSVCGIPFPSGIICMWHGLIANIPGGWLLCDGSNGTPDLRNRFVKGAAAATEAGATGGSTTHTHTDSGHTHPICYYWNCYDCNYDCNYCDAVSSICSPTGLGYANISTDDGQPPYYVILFIMKE